MPRKRTKTREKLGNFEDWEIQFMKHGPPSIEEQKRSGHGFAYLGGGHIWQRLKKEPGVNLHDFPWGMATFENKEKPKSEESG